MNYPLILRTVIVSLFTLVSGVVGAASNPPASVGANTTGSIALDLTREAVTIRAEEGATVILFNVAREPAGAIARVVSRHERLIDDDRDGVIRYVPARGVAWRSIWIVVDLETGALAVAAPGGAPMPMRSYGGRESLPAQAIVQHLDVERERVDILVVRPGVGAWAGVVRDGGAADQDRQANRRLRLDPARLKPLDESFDPAPHAFRPGDVVAILDSERLEYWLGAAAGGGQ